VFLSREYLRLIAVDPLGIQISSSPLVEVLEREIQQGIDAGVLRAFDARRAAEMIVNVVASEINVALAGTSDREPSTPDEIAAFCCGAIRRLDAPRHEPASTDKA
jgi:hypothetical protein